MIVTFAMSGSVGELELVRGWAREHLATLSEEALDDVVLVLDELTSNAVVHGSPVRRVRLLQWPDTVRVEVDDGSRQPAHPREPSDTGGRGLLLVAALSTRWGQDHHDVGKTVWAELKTTSRPG
ncbi:ATP-binding protein [Amycolatopsis rhabdoformis]|uniref:ATP-binding protein n=1 Tax=Amycolatopsis rhabdoformis TaxID=1448059 RepID=A0ABZ1IC98_9PSEU|nr:ATP-binding protein [Amycolatopsis rhabdoformis]WSE32099.1 ATP-binding protein [Amycolatopsis rhabdoformis]